jgi:hypothetical protein
MRGREQGAAHLPLPLGGLPRRALAGGAADMVLAGAQVLAALWAELELRAVATLLAAAPHIWRGPKVHLEPP